MLLILKLSKERFAHKIDDHAESIQKMDTGKHHKSLVDARKKIAKILEKVIPRRRNKSQSPELRERLREFRLRSAW